MTVHTPSIGDRRSIIDRRQLADRLAALAGSDLQPSAMRLLREALDHGRAEIARRLAEHPGNGRAAAAAYAFLAEQIARLAFDFITTRLYPNPNPTAAERLALVGLGGTGRGEMAPFSDLDLMILLGDRRAPWCEQVAEALLYLLWDLQIKVGQSVRTIDEVVAIAKTDMTARTALLEARWLWGDRELSDEAGRRFRREVVNGTVREFVTAKLAERDLRHQRMGDSRYVVEPNVKDGKGGLRDLHTLYWIGQYAFGVDRPVDLVEKGLFTQAEYARFSRAERFFWSVRCHLHLAAGRAEERLGFEHQRQIAAAMNYTDRPGKSAVERFMQFYFLQAKTVGDLTGLFLAQFDEQMAAKGRRFALPTLRRRPKHLAGFVVDRGRLNIPSDHFLADDPVRLVGMFALAAREGLEIHPNAMRAASRDARLVDQVRDDPRANAFFLEVLTNFERPDTVLRWMNEAGVFGRFVPDFGRVVAQMQFDMYHHYTVDEHSIRAIGLLAQIERGELADDHPLSTALIKQIQSRRLLYVAVLLHDIAKGRGGDHSELGAEVALELAPRFGLDEAETETVAWLVRHHLLLSNTAMRRDLADPTTIDDFVAKVQSFERLRLLLILTVVDIRAVGPGVWNEWKRTLLRTLFEAAEERLRLGHKQRGRAEVVARRHDALAAGLGWKATAHRAHVKRLPDSYWLAEPAELQLDNARQVADAEARIGELAPSVVAADDPASGATRISVFAPDQPGLFYRICSALASAGANIIDARIHTTRDGMALDNLLVHDSRGGPYRDKRLLRRLADSVRKALEGGSLPEPPALAPLGPRIEAFKIAPRVMVTDRASRRTTVVEVNARDRPGLLARLAHAIHTEGLTLHSAHVATYGERAVDVFYLTDSAGKKLDPAKSESLRAALLEVAAAR
ncbi:[protein-PII] uridylyltransferase [Sphingomonas rhizophila]|uniref:Bifunctional uridylyltransferase/uridylyl-removing enzyme n=1 Tax=Sphingomonas rhizophila TaxID=2071607 RepID=A0A7G9SA74_9SPHN|nr:[protein-PII] uridylyltransferase [Sphingomonas rhizophila]QNN64749.1 [protein-PII] uridylyltransferase [Sphingomonas rhizophila]